MEGALRLGRHTGKAYLALALVVLPVALAGTLLAAPAPPRADPVLRIRLASWCYVGITNAPSPCPIETWIDETSGAVRERQTLTGQHSVMDDLYVPRHGGGWIETNRLLYGGARDGPWTAPAPATLPAPYPRSLVALRAAMRRLERTVPGAPLALVRGRVALALTVPITIAPLPWPLTTADIVYVDRATALPLRIVYVRGLANEIEVDEISAGSLPAGFLALPRAHGSLLDAVLSFVARIVAVSHQHSAVSSWRPVGLLASSIDQLGR